MVILNSLLDYLQKERQISINSLHQAEIENKTYLVHYYTGQVVAFDVSISQIKQKMTTITP